MFVYVLKESVQQTTTTQQKNEVLQGHSATYSNSTFSLRGPSTNLHTTSTSNTSIIVHFKNIDTHIGIINVDLVEINNGLNEIN